MLQITLNRQKPIYYIKTYNVNFVKFVLNFNIILILLIFIFIFELIYRSSGQWNLEFKYFFLMSKWIFDLNLISDSLEH